MVTVEDYVQSSCKRSLKNLSMILRTIVFSSSSADTRSPFSCIGPFTCCLYMLRHSQPILVPLSILYYRLHILCANFYNPYNVLITKPDSHTLTLITNGARKIMEATFGISSMHKFLYICLKHRVFNCTNEHQSINSFH